MKAIVIAATLALTVQPELMSQELVVHDLPDHVNPDMASIKQQLNTLGLEGVERNYWRAAMLDASADVTGDLRSGEGVAVKFPVNLARRGSPEVQQHEFVFTYTPKAEVVRGGVQFQDSTGRWVTPVAEAWGSGGTLRLQTGLLAESEKPVDYYFYAHDTVEGAGNTRKLAALRYRVSIKRVGVDAGEDPPRTGAWSASGTGSDFVDIPDSVLRLRISANYEGYSENFIVWCGTLSNRGDLLVNELMGTGWSQTDYTGVHENTRSYGGRGEPCGTLHVSDASGVDWEMRAISSR